jgi:hypothetical protein
MPKAGCYPNVGQPVLWYSCGQAAVYLFSFICVLRTWYVWCTCWTHGLWEWRVREEGNVTPVWALITLILLTLTLAISHPCPSTCLWPCWPLFLKPSSGHIFTFSSAFSVSLELVCLGSSTVSSDCYSRNLCCCSCELPAPVIKLGGSLLPSSLLPLVWPSQTFPSLWIVLFPLLTCPC